MKGFGQIRQWILYEKGDEASAESTSHKPSALYVILSLFICTAFVTGNSEYPQDYFSLPVNRSVQLSGTFGELRSNHFHAGLDIKSKDGTVGEQLRASAPGFISRIGVQSSGYGNVIYIDHPNGYTTVYGHMHRFPDDVQAYVKTMQYALEKFAVDLHPKPNQFVFQKGDVIGYLGNSGSSTGPHVHFEIRKTADQLPINPLLFGLPVEDKTLPGMRSLKVYYLDQDLSQIYEREYSILNKGSGNYELADTLVEGAWRVGFGLKVYDQMAGASNQNGIYGMHVTVDDVPQYHFELTSIPFSQTRYLNAHIDYAERRNGGGFYHRCFKLPGNVLGIYREEHEKGIVQLFENKPRRVEISAFDAKHNTSTLVFYVRRKSSIETPTDSLYHHTVDYLQSVPIQNGDLAASFEPHTFYQNVKLQVTKSEITMRGFYTPAYQILPKDLPVHRYFELTLRSSTLPSSLRSKAFIARISETGEVINCGGLAQDDFVLARVRSLGTFTIAVDTIAPEIIPITFRENMQGASRMQFRIGDNQATEGQANSLTFRATVDGKWILMEHDGKRSMLTHWFDERIGEGSHELVLTVRDDRGNVNTLKRTFRR